MCAIEINYKCSMFTNYNCAFYIISVTFVHVVIPATKCRGMLLGKLPDSFIIFEVSLIHLIATTYLSESDIIYLRLLYYMPFLAEKKIASLNNMRHCMCANTNCGITYSAEQKLQLI